MNIREGLKRIYILAIVCIEIVWIAWPVTSGDWDHPYSHRTPWGEVAVHSTGIIVIAVIAWFAFWRIMRWVKDGFQISN